MRMNQLFRLVGVLGVILLGGWGFDGAVFAQTVSPMNPIIAQGQSQQFVALNNNSQLLPLQQARSVVSGYYHSCALLLNGTVKCWGLNGYGQLGNGTTTNSDTPVVVTGLSGVTALAAGGYHTCAVLSNGQMKCWGYNYYGQLGNDTTNTSTYPSFVRGLAGSAVAITAGYMHTCAVLSGGSVQCWGSNYYGEVGNSNPANALLPTQIPGLSFVTSIAAGYYHTCALEVTATVYCWGNNALGQLGNNTTTNSSAPVQSWINSAKALVAGGYHTCALLDYGGEVMCWGDLLNSTVPNNVSGLTEVKALAAGSSQACALLYSGSAQCWGYNSYGELGNGSTVNSFTTPVNVSNLSAATSMSGGGLHTCAVIADGTVECWGYGVYGELGDSTTSTSYLPAQVVDDFIPDAGVRKIVNGANHTCALLGDGTAECWGYNIDGPLGNGNNATIDTPTPVANLTHAIDIAAGLNHTCALVADGTVECWGHSVYSSTPGCALYTHNGCFFQPVVVGNVTQAIAISAGGNHVCALIVDGTVDCWGQNEDFEVCSPQSVNTTTCGMPVAGVYQASAISTGSNHTCALSAGYATCWGNNGQYELGTTSSTYGPVQVSGLQYASSISAGDLFTCATLFTGAVQCWGYNGYGQLGDGTTFYDSSVPTTINLAGATSVVAGYSSACAVTANGNLYCWGDNTYGELGTGSTSPSYSPTFIAGLSGVVSASIGQESAAALLANGTVQNWGTNSVGQLGDGTWSNSFTPVPTVPLGNAATWTSSLPGIAIIDPVSGMATGLALGNTTITVKQAGKPASTTLTVN